MKKMSIENLASATSISASTGYFQSKQNLNYENEESRGCVKSNVEDKVEISSEARVASLLDSESLLANLFGVESTDGIIRIEDIRAQTKIDFAEFKDKLSNLLEEYGIERDPPFNLMGNGAGGVNVIGEHPQKTEIEQIFKDHPEMQEDYNRISANSSFLRACDEAVKFQKAYAQNPQEAVRRFAYLFSNNQPSFIMQVSSDNIMGSFM